MASGTGQPLISKAGTLDQYMVEVDPEKPFRDREATVYNASGEVVIKQTQVHKILRFGQASQPWNPLPLDQVPDAVRAKLTV